MTHPEPREAVFLAAYAMGTRFEFVLIGSDTTRLRAAGEAAIDEILLWEQRLSVFRPESVISLINRSAGQEWVRIDRETFALLAQCRELWAATRGAFDITIGPLLRAWGFRDAQANPCDAAVAQDADVPALQGLAWGSQHLELDEAAGAVRFARPGMSIDLGSIGKGFALDRVREVLTEAGVARGFVHGGTSSILALGSPLSDSPISEDRRHTWGVEIVAWADRRVRVELADTTLSVCAPRGRVRRVDGTLRGHIIDPRTGMPTPIAPLGGAQSVGTVAVIAQSAAEGDAWSTALLLDQEAASPPIGIEWTICRGDGSIRSSSGWPGVLPAGKSAGFRADSGCQDSTEPVERNCYGRHPNRPGHAPTKAQVVVPG